MKLTDTTPPYPFATEYSHEAMADVIAWFEARLDRLPPNITIEQGMEVPDTRACATFLLRFAHVNIERKKTHGTFRRMFQLRDVLLTKYPELA
ncbi:MAG: hypothetical protein Q4A44_04630 [Bacteroidales bacterium]|nr:hypothetical protein [Bacteroidales bacterium]